MAARVCEGPSVCVCVCVTCRERAPRRFWSILVKQIIIFVGSSAPRNAQLPVDSSNGSYSLKRITGSETFPQKLDEICMPCIGTPCTTHDSLITT